MSDGRLTQHALPPSKASGQAERLSTRALTISFVGRERELESALAHLAPPEGVNDGRALMVRGASGSGKTFFARELMRRLNDVQPDGLYLYVDVANDEYQSSRTLTSLLRLSFVPGPMTSASTISVPEKLSLQRFRRQAKQRKAGRGFLRAVAQVIGAWIGLGSAVSAALDGGGPVESSQAEDELVGYLSWASKQETVFITIDNLQFLNLDVRLTIESVLQRVGRNIRLIAIDRTLDGVSGLDPPLRCFSEATVDLQLENLTPPEIRQLVSAALGEDPLTVGRLTSDVIMKTGGLAKDVEYCLRQYSLELGRGASTGAIEGLLSTVDRLPLIHRQFLVIAALLDGGVKKAIARGTISRLATVYENASLDEVVDELVARDYLRLNSDTGDRLRPGHERIVTAIRELADDDLHEEVRQSLIQELAVVLEAPDAQENETYLLHCLVGLQTARELTRNLHHISRLIQSQHRQDQFSYLVAISDEIQEILPLLPEHVINDLLDAMQKSSAFDKGLQAVRLLDSKDVPGASARRIHRLKYLTQAYRYDEAETLSQELGDDEWGGVYRINALLALDRLDEARAITDRHLSEKLTECQAVLRRNTITLFGPETALQHLDEAHGYFEREQSDFRLATIDTNRGLVHLHSGRLGDALSCLDRARERMDYIRSREIYQAQINIAIHAALVGNYALAIATLDEAARKVPHALLLDRVKIDMNRAAIGCLSGGLDPVACTAELQRCCGLIRGVQMPYLHRALKANIAAANGNPQAEPPAADNRVSITIQIPDRSVTWVLPMSIHWRY